MASRPEPPPELVLTSRAMGDAAHFTFRAINTELGQYPKLARDLNRPKPKG